MQSDQPAELKEVSERDRKGKKHKKKRGKGSKGKRKGKGKGKKGSRKRKHKEEESEGSLLRLSEFQSQQAFQPTQLPETKTTEINFPTEAFDQTITGVSTNKPDFTTQAPTVVFSTVPVTKVTEEVDTLICRRIPSTTCRSNQSPPANHREHPFFCSP